MSITAADAWTLAIDPVETDWLSLTPASGKGSKDIVLNVDANKDSNERRAKIILKCGSKIASTELVQKSSEDTGGNNNENINPSLDGKKLAESAWMELPAIPSDSKYGYITHTMTMQNKKVRNYSLCWDYQNLVAPWVAYPLCKAHTAKNVDRSDAWGLDPYLDEEQQPVLYKGFKEGNCGWKARGHQLPSADRLFSYEANAQTFYSTNMTPQINDKFNSSIWANLEGKVRGWAESSDTLYVITGCLTDGSSNYCLDNVGKKVTVPTGYYKALLRYSKTSTLGQSGYMACAFWFEHRDYSEKNVSKSQAISIDELEKIIGLDLFVNLASKIGKEAADKVEAENPQTVSWWW